MPSRGPTSGPIRSEFANDPDMAELIKMFVTEMPERIAAVTAAFRAGDSAVVQRLAHQLKGASAGYGFPAVGRAAADVERSLKSCGGSPAEALAQVRSEVDALVEMCRRLTAG